MHPITTKIKIDEYHMMYVISFYIYKYHLNPAKLSHKEKHTIKRKSFSKKYFNPKKEVFEYSKELENKLPDLVVKRVNYFQNYLQLLQV